ncbi:glycosyltransferase [Gluconobacter cerinus]|uniref:glycosyltransferase n=1 Tax=Gluconobacter cerinus TaxID=38307 RepID=UPI002011B145|nr:glycosyltransferase family 2 protein [Gluconobacter cerinus]
MGQNKSFSSSGHKNNGENTGLDKNRHDFIKKQILVAIPVRNEEEHIVPCLLALARQETQPDKVVLWINNTTDQTHERVASLTNTLPFELEIVRVIYDPTLASAGLARRDAMAHAAQYASSDALLVTTDADSEAAEDWLSRTLNAFTHYPVEVVFGRALLLPEEARKIPFNLHEDERAEQAYGALLDQIALLLYPEPHDPWPRHTEHSGASIAVTYQAWSKVGGMPAVPTSEDRAFYQVLQKNGIRVRHAPDVKVYVSARLVGRAQGGMAETLARRLRVQDEYIDDIFEPVSRRLLRMRRLRQHANQLFLFENGCMELPQMRVRRDDLEKHHKRAQRVLDHLRKMTHRSHRDCLCASIDQFDIPHLAHSDQAPNRVQDMPE